MVSAASAYSTLAPGMTKKGTNLPALETLPLSQHQQFYDNSKNALGSTPLDSYKELYDRVELANAQKINRADEVVIKQKNE